MGGGNSDVPLSISPICPLAPPSFQSSKDSLALGDPGETEWDPMVLDPDPQVLCLPFSVQRIIREMRNAETKEDSQRRPNNNTVVIKQSQGPLVPSQGP